MDEKQKQFTQVLGEAKAGKPGARDAMFSMVYKDLRRMARRQLSSQNDQNLTSSADLVHELYLKLTDKAEIKWNDSNHFFSVAATAMRHILVDHARKRTAKRRGGNAEKISLDRDVRAMNIPLESRLEEIISVDDALSRLETVDPRLSKVVEYRYFVGFTEAEVAEILGIGKRTVQREWIKAKAWLYKEMGGEP